MIGQRVGYVRVSTEEQSTERQLEGVEVARTFVDHAGGKDVDRPQLALCLGFLREGDTLLVHSCDRLARSLVDLRQLVDGLVARGVRVEFVKEHLMFSGEDSPSSVLMLSMLGAFAEFERSMIRSRQREGIALAKRRGVYHGRVRKLSVARAAELVARVESGAESKAAIARDFGVHPTTLYLYLKRASA
jgi:DNA invertase Pin-like site-specific DNA recombinase